MANILWKRFNWIWCISSRLLPRLELIFIVQLHLSINFTIHLINWISSFAFPTSKRVLRFCLIQFIEWKSLWYFKYWLKCLIPRLVGAIAIIIIVLVQSLSAWNQHPVRIFMNRRIYDTFTFLDRPSSSFIDKYG